MVIKQLSDMGVSPFYHLPAIYLVAPFLLLLIFFNWLGYRYRTYQSRKKPGITDVGLGPTEGSLIGLTALLLSFAFGMTASKFDARRKLIVEESNEIGTVILRCDLYPDSIRNQLRADMKNYLESRIAYYNAGDQEQLIAASLRYSDSISSKIWQLVARSSQKPEYNLASRLIIPSLNDMIDIVSTREGGRLGVVPRLILIVLSILIFVSAFLSGYGSKENERNRVLVWAFALMTTLTLYLVVELDRPRQGLINLSGAEQMMVDLRAKFIP